MLIKNSQKQEETYITNPNVFMVQSRLFSPAFQGSGKWSIFNPENRKAYVACGKNETPDIVKILMSMSRKSIKQSAYSFPLYPERSRLESLIKSKLLISSNQQNIWKKHSDNFIDLYQQAVYNYPFHDYFDPNWREKDVELMDTYSKMWKQPKNTTLREGVSWKLPVAKEANLYQKDGKNLTLKYIASILRYVYGPISERPAQFDPVLRKTVPSGGGKHPTECVVIFPIPYEGIPKGIYVYDVKKHILVDENDRYDEDIFDYLPNDEIVGFLIRSRLERPMWRYRDIRSYRPVLIDAGHCVEMMRQFFSMQGNQTSISSPLYAIKDGSFSWLEEPELALLVVGSESSSNQSKLQSHKNTTLTKEKKYVTNPAMYITFEDGEMVANVLWPKRRKVILNSQEFEAITHCLPSRRGDRDTSIKGVITEIEGMVPSKMDYLISNGVLIPKSIGVKFYHHLHLWVQHGWYLTFLARLEIMADEQKIDYTMSCPVPLLKKDHLPLLFQRKTTRSFTKEKITKRQMLEVLSSALPREEMSYHSNTKIIFAAQEVSDIKQSAYEWNPLNQSVMPLGENFSSEEIRHMTIGQSCAGAGSMSVWIISELDLSNPAKYELDMMKLGQIGQRICISCAKQNLGVFMTPAVNDQLTFERLGLDNKKETVIYFFTIGHKREGVDG